MDCSSPFWGFCSSRRFDSTASSIQTILGSSGGGYEERDKKKNVLSMFGDGRAGEDDGRGRQQQQAQQNAKIASQLAIWKVGRAKRRPYTTTVQ